MTPRIVKSFLQKVKGKPGRKEEEQGAQATSASQLSVGGGGLRPEDSDSGPTAARDNYPIASPSSCCCEYGHGTVTTTMAMAMGMRHGYGVDGGGYSEERWAGDTRPRTANDAQQREWGGCGGTNYALAQETQLRVQGHAQYRPETDRRPRTGPGHGPTAQPAHYLQTTDRSLPQSGLVRHSTEPAHLYPSTTTTLYSPPTRQTPSPSPPLNGHVFSAAPPSAVSSLTPTVTARVTIPEGTSHNDAANMILNQIVASIATAQNSCPVHKRCDPSCPRRIGVANYHLPPSSSERVTDETNMRIRATSLTPPSVDARALPPASELPQPVTIGPDTPVFQYAPLEKPNVEMRLLKIKPAHTGADTLDCELVHININDAPAYGALSYYWGGGPYEGKMLCNGALFAVKRNLEMALKRLRAGFASGGMEEYIWADAICIDQRNETEKSHQIMLMRYIYSRAQTVYVDLGDVQDRSPRCGGVAATTWGGGGDRRQDALTKFEDPRNHHHHTPLHYKTVFLALAQPWFKRTWIIQEVALAKRALFIFQGELFEREELDRTLDKGALMGNPERMEELLLSGDATIRGFVNYNRIKEIKQMYQQQQQNDSLKLMQLTADFSTTVPKDKIYALMALMSEYDQEAIGPYSQPLATVFRKFAALHVRYGRAITMLDSAGIQRRRIPEYLPSWVPDWTAQSPSPKVISTLRPLRYAAGGPTIAEVALAGDETGIAGLSVRGYLVDTLDSVYEMMPSAPDGSCASSLLEGHKRARAAFDAWVSRGGGRRNYADDAKEAFVRLLLMDDTYTGPDAVPHSSAIENPVATYEAALDRWRADGATKKKRPAVVVTGGGGRTMDAVETFQMRVEMTCRGRSFAITRGGYVALVPAISRPGDEVVVFWGATVPYVVRRGPIGFTLVGDGYVQGIMEGEGVAGLGVERLANILLV